MACVYAVDSCFHNLALHGSGEHTRPDYVRWALDLRYERAPDASRYSQGNQYYEQYPSFNQHVSWQEWRQMWSEKRLLDEEEVDKERADPSIPNEAAIHKMRL